MDTLFTAFFSILAILSLLSNAAAASVPEIQSTIFYVKPGGTGDCSNWYTACELQIAFSLANAGDQVWVAAGIYLPTTDSNREASFSLESGVAIYGGFPIDGGTWEERDWETNLTTLSGDIGVSGYSNDNIYHVVTGNEVNDTAILDGFTIYGGNANLLPTQIYGGGMYNRFSNPTLTNVTFSGNSATAGGGIYNESSNPTLTDVIFSGNSASNGGGMFNYDYSSPVLTNVTFLGNSSSESGGGTQNKSNSSPTMTNVTFTENSAALFGGGMLNENSSSPTLTNVTFNINSAGWYGGGMANSSSSPILTNITFSANSASQVGGGIYNFESSPTLTNVTFFENSAVIYGGGMVNNESSPTLTNAILWGNTPDQIYDLENSLPIITYSDIQGEDVWEGTGNIIDNPLIGPLANNGGFTQTHALGVGSPAIDAGDPNLCPSTDQRGFYRPIDGDGNGVATCDMGAYEYGSSVVTYLHLPLIVK